MLLKLPHAALRGSVRRALERPLGRIRLAGDYLGGVYTDTAISTGLAVRSALQATPNRP